MITNDYICRKFFRFLNLKHNEPMKHVDFKEANTKLGSDGVKVLPAYVDEANHLVVTCWRMSFWERVKALFLGKVWVCSIADKKSVQRSVPSMDVKRLFGQP